MHMARKAVPFAWTLEDLDRLPDDGNRYELVRGELFVTPAPNPRHERLAVVLSDILSDYARQERIGRVFRPRAVIRIDGSEVEPDVMVRAWSDRAGARWDEAPIPLLVVEILSDITRGRDHGSKHAFYLGVGVPEYWIVDGDARTIRVVRPGKDDFETRDTVEWNPTGATAPFTLDVRALFREALGA